MYCQRPVKRNSAWVNIHSYWKVFFQGASVFIMDSSYKLSGPAHGESVHVPIPARAPVTVR